MQDAAQYAEQLGFMMFIMFQNYSQTKHDCNGSYNTIIFYPIIQTLNSA